MLWPLLLLKSIILGLIWRGTAYFVQNDTTLILPDYSDQRAGCQTPCAKLRSWRHKMFHIFPFLQSSVIFGILKAVSSEKIRLTLMPFLVDMHLTSVQHSFCWTRGSHELNTRRLGSLRWVRYFWCKTSQLSKTWNTTFFSYHRFYLSYINNNNSNNNNNNLHNVSGLSSRGRNPLEIRDTWTLA